MRLSITFDCWKNSCHGATVVPTIAMISSTEVEFAPPWIPGTKKSWATLRAVRVRHEEQRDDSRLANTNTNIERSQERKLPLTVIATSATAAIGTATYSDTPK